jgi:hypothetical protein
MFVGHYAASLALKGYVKEASLGVLFLAVQFVDILFFPFVLLGIERIHIVENYTQSTHFELVYMPYTHSLLAFIVWSGLAYSVFRWVVVKDRAVALVIALAVFSHWVLDVLVHTPDLPLSSDESTKIGLGLWNNAIATYAVESMILLLSLWVYLRLTTAVTSIGKYGMGIFVGLLLLINAANIFGPPMVNSESGLAIFALSSYFLFAAVAFWLDRKRT